MSLVRPRVVGLDGAGIHDHHDRAHQRPACIDGAQQHGGASVAQIVGKHRRALALGEGLQRLANRIMLVRSHGAFAQPEHIPVFVVQGNGMGARRLDRRAHFLADGIEIDERTFRCAEGFALLHRSDTGWIALHIYRTGPSG